MRYVEPKTGDQQARSILFRTREQFVKQRTEAVNALRSHLYEFGFIAPKGIGYLPRFGAVIEDPNSDLPPLAREICHELLDHVLHLTGRINAMKKRIDAIAREGGPRRAVVQCALAADHGGPWFTRCWASEYSVLFGAILPVLSRLGLPFLLGGTSQFLRRDALMAAGAYEAANITEDADLGVRLARLGRTSAAIPSVTWEEAPVTQFLA